MPTSTEYYIDVVDGAHGKLTIKGWELYRRVTVNQLLGPSYAGPLLIPAAYAIIGAPFTDSNGVSQAPIQYGYPHPAQVDAVVQEIDFKAVSQSAVQFDIKYASESATGDDKNGNPTGIIEVGASVQNVQTNVDAFGNTLTVKYTGDRSKLSEEGKASFTNGKTGVQLALVSAPRAAPTIKITRQEFGDPSDKADFYVGTCNESGWSRRPSAKARQWLCTSILGTTKTNVVWSVTYCFQKSVSGPLTEGTWDQWFYWIDPGTGRPVEVDPNATRNDLINMGAIAIAQTIESADFNGLGL